MGSLADKHRFDDLLHRFLVGLAWEDLQGRQVPGRDASRQVRLLHGGRRPRHPRRNLRGRAHPADGHVRLRAPLPPKPHELGGHRGHPLVERTAARGRELGHPDETHADAAHRRDRPRQFRGVVLLLQRDVALGLRELEGRGFRGNPPEARDGNGRSRLPLGGRGRRLARPADGRDDGDRPVSGARHLPRPRRDRIRPHHA